MTNRVPADIDFLVIGHVTHDLVDGAFALGGTVSYAGMTARALGRRVGILTSAADDVDFARLARDIAVVRLPSPVTTTFRNIYQDGVRRQYLRAVAAPIPPSAVPEAWTRCPVVLLGPLTQEIPVEMVSCFPSSLVGVTPQGWLRRWDADGFVSPTTWDRAAEVVPRVQVVILSLEDVGGDQGVIDYLASMANILVVTAGWNGSTVYYAHQVRHFPAQEVEEVDPTGAGDVYAAAYLVRLEETGDPWESARFANCVAGFSVTKPGLSGIPTRQDVEQRLSCRLE